MLYAIVFASKKLAEERGEYVPRFRGARVRAAVWRGDHVTRKVGGWPTTCRVEDTDHAGAVKVTGCDHWLSPEAAQALELREAGRRSALARTMLGRVRKTLGVDERGFWPRARG